MALENPAHPGKAARVSCLEPLRLNVTEGAKVLGVKNAAAERVSYARGFDTNPLLCL